MDPNGTCEAGESRIRKRLLDDSGGAVKLSIRIGRGGEVIGRAHQVRVEDGQHPFHIPGA